MSALVPTVTRELSKMKRTLHDVFGLEKLRPGQATVIRSVLEGKNTLATMPTGAGKSLCYQLPALHIPGTTVIVSPLISLMKDQVDKLEDAGLEVSQLHSSLNTLEQQENLKQLETESNEFLFVTAERFTSQEFRMITSGNKWNVSNAEPVTIVFTPLKSSSAYRSDKTDSCHLNDVALHRLAVGSQRAISRE